jgi:hypothetical protein
MIRGSSQDNASADFLSVNYGGMIPLLVKAIQEEQIQLEILNERIEKHIKCIVDQPRRIQSL